MNLILIFLLCACNAQDDDTLNSNTTEFIDYLCDDENSGCVTTESEENVTSTDYELNSTETSILNDTLNFTIFGNKPKINYPEINYNSIKNYNIDFCLCDLQQNYCNFDCCCDSDCTYAQKMLFSKCETQQVYHDLDYCYTFESVYINMSKVMWENPENRLFCIVKTNFPSNFRFQKEMPIQTIKNAEKFIINQNKWPKFLTVQKFETESPNYELNFGNNIWLFKNEDFSPLRLPINFISNKCVQKSNIQFQKDFFSTCSQNIIDQTNNDLNPENYFKNISFLSLSKFSNISLHDLNINDCPKNICVPINRFVCNEFLSNCSQIINETNFKLNCHFNVFKNEQSCYFITKKIIYEIFHNTTHGITKINLFLNFANLTYFLTDEIEVIQTFEVKFYWENYKQNFTEIFSGNPGYLLGNAILYGTLNDTKLNVTKKEYDLKISINDCDILKNNLIFPKNIKGYCVLNNESYSKVEFGYNVKLNCIQTYEYNLTKNATNICLEIQKSIFKIWQINIKNNSRQYVGMFGNANRLEISEWIKILYKFNPLKILDKISGEFKSDKLFCNYMIQTLKVNIIYTNIDFEFSKKQAKLLNVFYDVEEIQEIKLIRDLFALDTSVEIMFFDITNEKVNNFIKHDLFYPFNMNKFNNNEINYLLIFSLCIFTFAL